MKAAISTCLIIGMLFLSGCVVDPLPTPGESTALSGGTAGPGGGADQGSSQPNAGAADAVEQADAASETDDIGVGQAADMMADD